MFPVTAIKRQVVGREGAWGNGSKGDGGEPTHREGILSSVPSSSLVPFFNRLRKAIS